MPGDEPQDPQARGLVEVLHLIASRLRHPLFLIGLGASILLTLIALGGPEGGQLYAALLAGLVFLLAVVWALSSRRTTRAGHHADVGTRARAGNITQESDRGAHKVRTGRSSVVKDITQRSGSAPRGPSSDDP